MKKLSIKNHHTEEELQLLLKQEKNIRIYLDWQIVLSIKKNEGKTALEFSSILGVSKSKIYQVSRDYNLQGKGWKPYDKWGGRREARCLLSLKEELSILKGIEEEALVGKILIYKHVKSIVELKIGKKVSDDYIWDMFKRHDWKKKVPRGHHPKRDILAQDEYKKNSKRTWQPNH